MTHEKAQSHDIGDTTLRFKSDVPVPKGSFLVSALFENIRTPDEISEAQKIVDDIQQDINTALQGTKILGILHILATEPALTKRDLENNMNVTLYKMERENKLDCHYDALKKMRDRIINYAWRQAGRA